MPCTPWTLTKPPNFYCTPRGTTRTRQARPNPRRQDRPRLGISRGRSCRPSALALCSASASVASDPEKGDGMSLRKRGGIWWIDVRAPDGERIRRTTGTATKALAQESHDRFKSELWRIANLGEKPQHTWNEAVVRWLKEQSHKATAKRRRHQTSLARSLPGRQGSHHHHPRNLDRITDAKLALGRSNATVNRTMELVRAILRKCVNDWEWLDRAPKVRMLKEPTRRIRFLTRDEAQRAVGGVTGASRRHGGAFRSPPACARPMSPGCSGRKWIWCGELAWVHPDQAKRAGRSACR